MSIPSSRRNRPTQPLLLLAIIALFSVGGGCGKDPDRRDVIFISIDTLRADRLGCTGHDGAVTPILDGLAATGTLYPNGVSPTPLTLPSHATMFTGRLPIEHGIRDNRPFTLPDESETTATLLSARGYHTAAFIGGEPLARGCGLEQGFDHYDDDVKGGALGSVRLRERTASQVTDAAIDHVRAVARDEPLFLFVHYFDPHDPYVPPAPFAKTFAERPYDGEIAFVDEQIGRLLATLEKTRTRTRDALIVVTSDHGESLGEHGEPTHGIYLYDATIRVPVIVKDGEHSGRTRNEQVRLQDLNHYIAERSANREADLAAPANRGESAFIESLYGAIHCDYAQLRGLRTANGAKYLEAGDEELYDLQSDPGEENNLVAERSYSARLLAARQELAREIDSFRTDAASFEGKGLPGYFSSPIRSELLRTLSRDENRFHPSPASRRDAIANLHEGVRLAELKLFAAAADQLATGVERDPDNPTLWYWVGRVKRSAAHSNHDPTLMAEAIDAFAKTRALRPEHVDARDLQLFCLAEIGRYEEALAIGAEAEQKGDATASTLDAMGRIRLMKTGGLTKRRNPLFDEGLAADFLFRAYELDPRRADRRALEYLRERYSLTGARLQAAQVEQWLSEQSPDGP